MAYVIDLTGKQFGDLVVQKRVASDCRRVSRWKCRCKCGTTCVVNGDSLRRGNTKSCGCRRRLGGRFVHGEARHGKLTPEYVAWRGMKIRCYCKNSSGYKRYGGRGIRVSAAWLNSFERFLRDMGRRPGPEYSLDRKRSDGNYTASNCRWATQKVQARNKRSNRLLTFRGQTLCLADWAKVTGLPRSTITRRLKRGLTVRRALTTG